MQNTKQREEDIFADVLEKIKALTASQQKFLQEILLRHEKVAVHPKKSLLKKSFGIWADRKDIKGSIEYIDEIRKGWEARLQRKDIEIVQPY